MKYQSQKIALVYFAVALGLFAIDCLAFGECMRYRFLAIDILSVAKSFQCAEGVPVVWRSDHHGIDILS